MTRIVSLVFVSLAVAAVLAGAATWTYDPPALPSKIVIVNDPVDGWVTVLLPFQSSPDSASAAKNAPPAKWTERGRMRSADALACYNSIEILDDSKRPGDFAQPRPRADAGPE